jgi:hypothetical protein
MKEIAMAKSKKPATMKAGTRKRSLNVPGKTPSKGAPFNDQDVKRRLGQFESAGEHARVGSRNKGIVGHHDQNARAGRGKKSR